MKALRLLGLPWMAWSKDARENIALLVAAIATIAAFVVGVAAANHSVAVPLLTIGSLAIVNWILWWLGLSQAMLLAREARRLRLPALGRDVLASVTLYALLTIVLPAFVLSMLGTNVTEALIWLALAAGVGLGMATLPNWMVAVMWPIFILAQHLFTGHHTRVPWLPAIPHPMLNPMTWVAAVACVLWLSTVICWRRAVIHQHAAFGINRPALWSNRTLRWYGRGQVDNDAETQRLKLRGRWWQYAIDLRGSGPSHAVASLRVMLGGWAMPQTLPSWICRFVTTVVCTGLVIAFWVIYVNAEWPSASSIVPQWLLWLYIASISPIIAQTSTRPLQRRWNRSNAELPLLALLPGLDKTMPVKRALLRACLLPAFAAQCLLFVATLGAAPWLHIPHPVLTELLLADVSGMAVLLAITLTMLGGSRVDGGEYILFWIGFVVVFVLGATASSADSYPIPTVTLYTLLVVIWSFLFVPLLLIAHNGWRAYQRRPHPFLANQP